MKKHFHNPAMMLASLILIFGVTSAFGAEGLNVTIEKVTINDQLLPVVDFSMLDNAGLPIAAAEVAYRFVFAHLEVTDAAKGISRYKSYISHVQTVPDGFENAGAMADQAAYDNQGPTEALGGGRYRYTFSEAIPANYQEYSAETHSMSGQFQRNVGGKTYVANPLFHYVPNGSEVVELRKVVTSEGCNVCHSSLAIHGGSRREIGYCIMCHNPGTIDPDTGNTVDMAVMTHKIHRGAGLPSVQAGGQYKIVGYRQSTHDYSHVEFPQDIRNCATCHKGPDADVFKTAPTRMVCGSCHDNVNFQTGAGHGPGIPQMDDNACASCHPAEGPEFGLSVAGAHTIPGKSAKLKGLNVEILEVTDAAPGGMPTIRFTMTENDGTPVDISTMGRLSVVYGGPSKEYASYYSESMLTDPLTVVQNGAEFSYLLTNPIPADMSGTLAFTIEGRRDVVLVDNPGEEPDVTTRESIFNPIKYVAITDSSPVQRRKVIAQEKCNACHDSLAFHGGQRINVDYCVVCHNPNVSDVEERPEGVTGGESVSFGFMIHKIHRGHNLNQEFLVFGHNSSEHEFNEVLFPGDITQCNLCHIQNIPNLPLPSVVRPISFLDAEENQITIPPTTAICTSCHDNDGALAHAILNTTDSGIESCSVCHMGGRTADILIAHEQRSFLNVIEIIGEAPSTLVEPWIYY